MYNLANYGDTVLNKIRFALAISISDTKICCCCIRSPLMIHISSSARSEERCKNCFDFIKYCSIVGSHRLHTSLHNPKQFKMCTDYRLPIFVLVSLCFHEYQWASQILSDIPAITFSARTCVYHWFRSLLLSLHFVCALFSAAPTHFTAPSLPSLSDLLAYK